MVIKGKTYMCKLFYVLIFTKELCRLSNIVNELIEEYIRNILPKRNKLLESIEDFALNNHIPIVQPEVAKLLEVMVKISNAKNILEIGTAIGYSAIILSNATNNGNVTTIEKRQDMINIARKNIQTAGLNEKISILEGDAQEILPTIQEQFDLIFIDAAKGHYMEFLSSSIHLLFSGGVIISDNVLYKGMTASNQYVIRRKKTIVKRMRAYLDYIINHPHLISCILPVGDGVAISYKE